MFTKLPIELQQKILDPLLLISSGCTPHQIAATRNVSIFDFLVYLAEKYQLIWIDNDQFMFGGKTEVLENIPMEKGFYKLSFFDQGLDLTLFGEIPIVSNLGPKASFKNMMPCEWILSYHSRGFELEIKENKDINNLNVDELWIGVIFVSVMCKKPNVGCSKLPELWIHTNKNQTKVGYEIRGSLGSFHPLKFEGFYDNMTSPYPIIRYKYSDDSKVIGLVFPGYQNSSLTLVPLSVYGLGMFKNWYFPDKDYVYENRILDLDINPPGKIHTQSQNVIVDFLGLEITPPFKIRYVPNDILAMAIDICDKFPNTVLDSARTYILSAVSDKEKKRCMMLLGIHSFIKVISMEYAIISIRNDMKINTII
jgi:hypothetical protein